MLIILRYYINQEIIGILNINREILMVRYLT